MNNNYYDIACNDLNYLLSSLHSGSYNNISIGAQQVSEKMLKDLILRECEVDEDILRSHNLRRIYLYIKKYDDELRLDLSDLAFLKDYYYDAKYPGDNFITVSMDECNKCLDIMYDVIAAVSEARKRLDLPIINIKRQYADDSQFVDYLIP